MSGNGHARREPTPKAGIDAAFYDWWKAYPGPPPDVPPDERDFALFLAGAVAALEAHFGPAGRRMGEHLMASAILRDEVDRRARKG